MRLTVLLTVLLLALALPSLAGGPGRFLRPDCTRSSQTTALSPQGPSDPIPTGALEAAVILSICIGAVGLTALRTIDRH